MGKYLGTKPCPACRSEGRDRKGDNLAVYDDGGYCFSCGYRDRGATICHIDSTLEIDYNVRVGGEKGPCNSAPLRHRMGLSPEGWDTRANTQQHTSDDDTTGGSSAPSSYHPGTPPNVHLERGGGKDLEGNDEEKEKSIFESIGQEPKSSRNQPKGQGDQPKSQQGKELTQESDQRSRQEYKPWRNISADTMRFFDVPTQGTELIFDYGPATLVRDTAEVKKYRWLGSTEGANLFGKARFNAGGKTITVTEGAHKAMAVYQMTGTPAVAVKSASSAYNDCQAERDYLNTFEKIILSLDGDKAGQEATRKIALMFSPAKVRYVPMTALNDPTDYLEARRTEEYVKAWQNAKPCLPKGIIGTNDEVYQILQKEDKGSIATYPFASLDKLTYGIRAGELVLVTAQQKIGKTEVIRAIEYHLLTTTEHKVGIIHLEESEKRSVQGLATYHLNRPCHLPDSSVSADDAYEAYVKLTRDDGRAYFYTHFGSDDPAVILDHIRYMVAGLGCKFIFLDHMTMLVSGSREDDERRTLDFLATRFAMLTRELDFTLFVVSHVNDDGLPRGSRMISKTCDLHIHLERDKIAADPETRNTTKVILRENRFSGQTGPSADLLFNPKTFTIKEREVDASPKFDFSIPERDLEPADLVLD